MPKNGKGNGHEPEKPPATIDQEGKPAPAPRGPLVLTKPAENLKPTDKRLRKGRKHTIASATTSPREIKRRARMAEAIEYRLQGHAIAAIAQQMKASPATIHAYLVDAMAEMIREPADALKDMELQRLELLMAQFLPVALEGDTNACDRVLKIMELRAKLLGFGKADGGGGNTNIFFGQQNNTFEAKATGPSLKVEFVHPPQPPREDGGEREH